MPLSPSSRRHIDGAKAAMELRERMVRTGKNLAGQDLWTDDELNQCRDHYPDRDAIAQRLPRRSAEAIRHKCNELGLTPVRNQWTGADVMRLRKIYHSATWRELLAAFPGRSEDAIRVAANKRGMRRDRKPYKVTGNTMLDQLRTHCFEKGYTKPDLDFYAKSGKYFQRSEWSRNWFSARIIARAVRELGGEIKAEWE